MDSSHPTTLFSPALRLGALRLGVLRLAAAFAPAMLILGVWMTAVSVAEAELSEPDQIYYGQASVFGDVPDEGEITVALNGDPQPVASYAIGSDPDLGEFFVLRLPIDAVDPRRPGTARPGDQAEFFIDGELAGRTTIAGRGVVTRLDLDPEQVGGLPSISIGDAEVVEGDSGTVGLVFTLTLSESLDETVTVQWATADDSATAADADYVADAQVATFGIGDTTTTVEVAVNGDIAIESDESFFVNLSGPSANATVLDGQGVGTILDDDTPPALSINDVRVAEADADGSGMVDAVFRVSLSHLWDQDVSFTFATSDGSATAGEDYLSNSGAGTVPQGSLITTVTVQVLADAEDESDETFFVDLGNPVGGSILDGRGVGTITDDQSFLIFVEQQKNGSSGLEGGGLDGALAVAVSPDGEQVYATGYADDALTVFARGASTEAGTEGTAGALTAPQVIFDGDDLGGLTVDGLDGASSVAVSPDGLHIYVASFIDDAVAVFERGGDDALSFVEAIFDGDSQVTATVSGLGGATAVVVSPDPDGAGAQTGGEHVYVVGEDADAVAVFERDAVTGELTFLEAEVQGVDDPSDVGGTVAGLDGPVHAAFSSDGEHLYVVSPLVDSVVVFRRETDSGSGNFGRLSFVETVRDGVGGFDGLNGARWVAVSPAPEEEGTASGSEHLYIAASDEDALAVLGRDTDSGTPSSFGRLSFLSKTGTAAAGGNGLLGARSVEVSAGGDFVYAAAYLADAVSVFRRDAATGALSFIEAKVDGQGESSTEGAQVVDGLWRVTSVAVSPDEESVYATGNLDDAVAVFARDVAAPENPTLDSPSHSVGVWSNDPTVEIEWSGAADLGHSGLAGYSFLFDEEAATVPDEAVDLAHSADPHSTESAALADSMAHYFHLRTCDRAENCADAAEHLGPFFIDTTAPADPVTLVSTSHSVASPSVTTEIVMVWSGAADAASGVAGYAYAFSENAATECDEEQDLAQDPGDNNTVTSDPQFNGSYYFHLCTVDVAGNWSSGTTVGPYVVQTVDSTSPQITAVDTVATSDDGALTNGEDLQVSLTQVLASFSETLFDAGGDPANPNSVLNPDNYQLVEAGEDGQLDTTQCGALQGDDAAVLFNAVDYQDPTAALRLDGSLALTPGLYRLLVCASLVDPAGNPLDGAGGAGTDFALTFDALPDNLLRNPNFDGDLSFWIPTPQATPDIDFADCTGPDCGDAGGAFSSGSARLQRVTLEDFFSISQCVEVAEDENPFTRTRAARV
ncbi:MAG: beta-propeller fold lactonase family protein, partial [Acidobacteriota bacterium]|nr:beta-propeller fold lactonase family protein [Acidobacteriota bacterium]